MPELTLNYRKSDTTLDRLEKLAQDHGIPVEMLAKRLISEGLGDYGLCELSSEEQESVKSLNDLFIKTGLRKEN